MWGLRRLPWIEWGVARYIERQRNRWHAQGQALSPELRARLSAHFSEEDLNRVRLVEGARSFIPNPPGFAQIRRWSGLHFLDPEMAAAITFDHVVVARQPVWDSLMFHELVHVTQYRVLGVKRFAEHYVRGFLETGSYEEIPLEACAYALEDEFLRGVKVLNVEGEVRKRFSV